MRVSLFITCLVDQVFPRVGAATAELLARLGVEVTFNPEQTCCGQPAFNTGYREEARAVAAPMLDFFERELERADYVVVPSGSCATMVKRFYAQLFEDEATRGRARVVGARVFELSQFLVEVLGVEDVGASFEGELTYHDSCHLLRELGVSSAPRALLRAVRGAKLVELDEADVCCGFGGTFSMKHPEISAAIAEQKAANVERSGARGVVACDVSCLMHTQSALGRRGSSVRCLHIAEVLASRGPLPV
jgi:L-lactate dehydrogenase complex protein LldE